MLRKILARYFCKRFYPTNSSDWYIRKGYVGDNPLEIFQDFIRNQRTKEGTFFKCFEAIEIERVFIKSANHKIDSVILRNNSKDTLPGKDTTIIMFQGRGEYYESRFRDMALICKNTGADVIGFNPKGYHSSTGRTKILQDIVDDGVSLLNFYLNKGLKPNDIIMIGNSLGGGVQEMVCNVLKKNNITGFKQINSNSFKNLASVSVYHLKFYVPEILMYWILRYAGWEINVDDNFYKTGLHRVVLRREGDRTIVGNSEYFANLNLEDDMKNVPEQYINSYKWLIEHNTLAMLDKSDTDPHLLSLHRFQLKRLPDDDNNEYTIFDFINKFIVI